MFSQKRERLISKLNDIKKQLKDAERDMKSRKLKKGEAAQIIAKLSAKRDKLELELCDLIVETEESFQQEAWTGIRRGLVASLSSIEKVAHDSIDYQNTPKTKAKKEEKANDSFLGKLSAKLTANPITGWISTALLVYLLLIAVDCLSGGFKMASGGPEGVKTLFAFASNPFAGLMVGILSTALIQSSSTTTSIIVGLCAAGLPVEAAIPMILGANVGTSVTNTLVSLGHIGHKDEFRRAFAAATIHDFFNLIAVIIFLPLELCFGILEKISGFIAHGLTGGAGNFNVENFNIIKAITKPVSGAITSLFKTLPFGTTVSGIIFIIFGIALVFLSILFLGKLLRSMLIGKAEEIFHKAVGGSAIGGISAGMGITVLVQSSSTTTSLVVPLAGAGVMSLRQVYPFTLGANIGTCVTALIAALAVQSGAEFALQIAIVHLLFNLLSVVVIYSIPVIREIPIVLAKKLARLAVKRKLMAIAYIIVVFFVLPIICIGISNAFKRDKAPVYCAECQKEIIQNN